MAASAVEAQGMQEWQGQTVCGIDHNFDGDYDGEGEIAVCDNGVCPLTAQACITNRVRQVCDPDEQITTCAPDETIEECEPDVVTRQCDPDTTRRECDPDTRRRVCDPDTRRRVCDPDTTRRECDPPTTRQECDPPTTRRECTPQPPREECTPAHWDYICHDEESWRCPLDGRRCQPHAFCHNVDGGEFDQGSRGYACVRLVEEICTRTRIPRQCRNVPQPDVCRTVTVPGQCRTVTVPGACRTVTVPGRCRWETVPGQCRWETVPGQCRTVIVPGPCRDVTVPGACTTRTVPGECVQETIPGECRDEPLPDACPIAGVDQCHMGADGVSRCSDTLCVDTGRTPIEDIQRERHYYVDDGARDASGECLNDIQVFTGRGMDCQRPGLLTLFRNCCKNRGEILRDSSGGVGMATGATVVSALFAGAEAATSALLGGATASGAASAGTAAMAAVAGPAAIGAGVYLLFTELLGFGCDAQDMETAALDGSGMCHFINTYCVARIPFIGCVQKARSYCCFNSKLGRIIHQQGRAQLRAFNEGWGEPKDPICRGFTPAEFQALNFADMDLSEYYDELAAQTEAQMLDAFEEGLEAYISIGRETEG
ncbi:conjugal transfer protein TraN [Eilatimonas milleporae]|nr:conjugal transfer protein TraN [Eilatimonas milleporae]